MQMQRNALVTHPADIVFLDFEASSLGKHGYPIEVAWVFASGGEESHLIRPHSSWTDWSAEAEAVHGIPRQVLMEEGMPLEEVAQRMTTVLTGRALYASAPSWDGQWLSKLLRAAGLPRHSLRLQDTSLVQRETVLGVLQAAEVPADRHEGILQDILAQVERWDDQQGPPAHRALADAQRERQLWNKVRLHAQEIVASGILREPAPE
ncbi:3'-5' exonuclease [Microvirga lenta]|uniref:3'-5' exonuclease n=1 Tax=Microvirga lenta TaxID=2881337 RepID=UPI001CFF97FE|nr:transcriptional regulator [Microvirga lenta]MCB5176460.1 transcriptional regulator [Microvirga lenta]